MYTVHLDTLGMIHNSTCIDIASRRLNNMACMFKFLEGVRNSTLVAVIIESQSKAVGPNRYLLKTLF